MLPSFYTSSHSIASSGFSLATTLTSFRFLLHHIPYLWCFCVPPSSIHPSFTSFSSSYNSSWGFSADCKQFSWKLSCNYLWMICGTITCNYEGSLWPKWRAFWQNPRAPTGTRWVSLLGAYRYIVARHGFFKHNIMIRLYFFVADANISSLFFNWLQIVLALLPNAYTQSSKLHTT